MQRPRRCFQLPPGPPPSSSYYYGRQQQHVNGGKAEPLPSPQTEEECFERFQGRIFAHYERQLLPLKEDLADWLNRTMGTEHVTADNFLSELDTGVQLCLLARELEKRLAKARVQGRWSKPLPKLTGRVWERAAKRSFYARDNAHNFLRFCRSLGVHENLLFESDDLVLHGQPRSVVLCLLEVARLAAPAGVEPPGLVSLENEIEEEQKTEEEEKAKNHTVADEIQQTAAADEARTTSPAGSSSSGASSRIKFCSSAVQTGDESEGELGGGALDSSGYDSLGGGTQDEHVSELEQKVAEVLQETRLQCKCFLRHQERLRMRRVSEGKYRVGDKVVFVRLLKGRHVMVRVGGGWDTLENFLTRHDPCRRGAGGSSSVGTSRRGSGAESLGSLGSLGGACTPVGGSLSVTPIRRARSATPEGSQFDSSSLLLALDGGSRSPTRSSQRQRRQPRGARTPPGGFAGLGGLEAVGGMQRHSSSSSRLLGGMRPASVALGERLC